MKTAIMQPYFFPYIGYFQLINSVDTFVFYDDVNYIKKGWINRNRILVNNQVIYINVPIENASQNCPINQTIINNEQGKWKQHLLKKIAYSYKKSPYFTATHELLKLILRDDITNVAQFNMSAIKRICSYLGMETVALNASFFSIPSVYTGERRILEICHKLNATVYINPLSGFDLYHNDTFKNGDVELKFLKSNITEYRQYKNEFVPKLSIIDVLMFNSISEIKDMLNDYQIL
ncbi:MAG: WbqC family protein [Saprospiraceae bacterium]|nr:WbqC family protein [Saprospiraceae bacterium]